VVIGDGVELKRKKGKGKIKKMGRVYG